MIADECRAVMSFEAGLREGSPVKVVWTNGGMAYSANAAVRCVYVKSVRVALTGGILNVWRETIYPVGHEIVVPLLTDYLRWSAQDRVEPRGGYVIGATGSAGARSETIAMGREERPVRWKPVTCEGALKGTGLATRCGHRPRHAGWEDLAVLFCPWCEANLVCVGRVVADDRHGVNIVCEGGCQRRSLWDFGALTPFLLRPFAPNAGWRDCGLGRGRVDMCDVWPHCALADLRGCGAHHRRDRPLVGAATGEAR